MSVSRKLQRAVEMCQARGLPVVETVVGPRIQTPSGWMVNPVLCLTTEEHTALYGEPRSMDRGIAAVIIQGLLGEDKS